MPNTNGLFLRGVGGNAGALGQAQIDAMRLIRGSAAVDTNGSNLHTGSFFRDAARHSTAGQTNGTRGTLGFNSGLLGAAFNGAETRPVNVAVRYLIRART